MVMVTGTAMFRACQIYIKPFLFEMAIYLIVNENGTVSGGKYFTSLQVIYLNALNAGVRGFKYLSYKSHTFYNAILKGGLRQDEGRERLDCTPAKRSIFTHGTPGTR
jgi:hypothetical protein